jgi:hypothetical protein
MCQTDRNSRDIMLWLILLNLEINADYRYKKNVTLPWVVLGNLFGLILQFKNINKISITVGL